MGYASHLIWKAGNETFEGEYGNALMFYAGSLALNLSFTPVFFGSKNLTAVSMVLFKHRVPHIEMDKVNLL